MHIVIAGGHGKIAMRLERLLAGRGDVVHGLVRNPAHRADVGKTGAIPVLCDLEAATVDEVTVLLDGADAVVFAAGAGPGSGIPRKDAVDHRASVLIADAAELSGVRRFVQISSMGAGSPPEPGSGSSGGEVFAAYLRAKAAAEEDLRGRGLDWTILRPGMLTDEPGTGKVTLAESVPRGRISRDDVAAVIVALLDEPATRQLTLELAGGDVPVAEAVRAAARRS